MTQHHDRVSGPPRPFLPPPPGQPESELQRTAREVLTELGYVWLGDLSGWEVVPVVRDTAAGAPLQLELRHRCGWAQRQPDEGITGDGAAYVGNLIERALEANQGHVCKPHEPSPEHQARVARWESMTDIKGPDDIPERPDANERVSGPPVRRPGLLYSDAPGLATPQHRVDGPQADDDTWQRGAD
jgi:hypothetical protein